MGKYAENFDNRFLLIEMEGEPSMRVVSEKVVSNRIDMSDCYDGEFKVFFLNDEGKLEAVKTSGFVRGDEESWELGVAGYSDLVTESGKQVGTVTHTDH